MEEQQIEIVIDSEVNCQGAFLSNSNITEILIENTKKLSTDKCEGEAIILTS